MLLLGEICALLNWYLPPTKVAAPAPLKQLTQIVSGVPGPHGPLGPVTAKGTALVDRMELVALIPPLKLQPISAEFRIVRLSDAFKARERKPW